VEDSDLSLKLDRLEEERVAALSGVFRRLFYWFFPKACDDPAIMQGLLSGIDPSLRYKPASHISKNEFVSTNMFRNISRYKGCNLTTGKIGATDVRFSMAHAEEKCKREVTDSKGRKRTEVYYETVFCGVIFSADFNKNITGLTTVSSGLFAGSNVKLENPVFNKFFSVSSSDQIEARYILTPSLMERLVEARKKFGTISLSFNGEKVFLALPMPYDSFDLQARSSATVHSQVEILRARLKSIIGLVDDLDLNTRIWTKK